MGEGMKTPDEIKKGLECCILESDDTSLVDHCKVCPYQPTGLCFRTLLKDVFAYIQQFEQINADFAERTAQLEAKNGEWVAKCHILEARAGKDMNVPRWISVEERLPEDNANVLVYAIGNNEHSVIAMTSYTHNMYGFNIEGWRAPWQYFFHEYKITHWMPLPSAPKEG